MTRIRLLLLSLLCFSASALVRAEVRKMQYYLDNGEIVCINGKNKYTRALYGTHTEWRLETSDRPIFATYKKNECRNIRLFLITDGKVLPLDSTSYCEARYTGGRRSYIVSNGSSWRIRIQCIASSTDEGAVWSFSCEGLPKSATLRMQLSNTKSNKFMRGGDLGKDDLSKFDADGNAPLQTISWQAQGFSYVTLSHNYTLHVYQKKALTDGKMIFEREERERRRLVSQVSWHTPDAVIDAIAPILIHAANGYWNGETWLHGCVGWRTPLAGWRGAYVGDVLGWQERSRSHYEAYARSQVTDIPATIPHPSQDTLQGLARAEKRWGTQMYSDGYICRKPDGKLQMHHYDMNLIYADGLLRHLSHDADTTALRRFFPVLKRHLAWEKRNFDPDGDHLYDAYCCIWASDALYYNGGAVTHSSAYNYRGNLLTARIAEILGEDPEPYRREAQAILDAMNRRLWLPHKGVWAEYQDLMGLRRLHESAAVWSVYTPIDCGACSSQQAYQATRYIDREIPHIPIEFTLHNPADTIFSGRYHTISTTNWQPYVWSTNNVAHEEVANTALAYLQAGRNDEGFRLLKGDIIDEMYLGASPGNFGQISHYDTAVSEAYRDFADNIGITARALINGLFGIRPDALNGQCIIQPAFPSGWQEAEIHTPYLSYSYKRQGAKDIYEIEQHFSQPLRIVINTNLGKGRFIETAGNNKTKQRIVVDNPVTDIGDRTKEMPAPTIDTEKMGLADITPAAEGSHVYADLTSIYNAGVSDIFKQDYLSPRPPYTTLEIPIHGIGQWCHPEWMATIDDSGLRKTISDGYFDTHRGLRFRLPANGNNIAFTSLWDNWPDSITIPLPQPEERWQCCYLMLAGSTNSMQSHITNGEIIATYSDGTTDTLQLYNPINWYPIEQDYVFPTALEATIPEATIKPLRFRLDNGYVSREICERHTMGSAQTITASGACADRAIDNGAGVILKMPLNPQKRLRSLRLVTLSNDIIIGIMGLTLERR